MSELEPATRKSITRLMVAIAILMTTSIAAIAQERVKTVNGIVEGAIEKGSGIRSFKGIPFAEPPVGDLRWKPPQPVKNWKGVRMADRFGPKAFQRPVFSDMVFRSNGMSEDCLYLNVWTPAKSDREKLPVLVYFYGGGFIAGDGSEPRYDGESMARKGIVAVTVNYRLNVFGFFAHPELTKESPQHASGNYGLLDQHAALLWVQKNISAFGGDPNRVTIAGESAGSISVSAQMVSPLSKNLIAGAIGESGSLTGTLTPVPLADAEQNGVKFASTTGANSVAALRAMPAEQLLEATAKQGVPRFGITIDGYFLPKPAAAIFMAGEQARVPLLAGWNSEESSYRGVLGQEKPTAENYQKALRRLYAERADEALKVYPGTTEAEVIQSATDLASDRFIGYSTWKWLDLHGKTGRNPVYRYFYSSPRPAMKSPNAGSTPAGSTSPPVPRGAAHSAEIEYAMGNLSTNTVYAWTPEDYKVSETMQSYFANFIKTGNPNGPGLPNWPQANGGGGVLIMHIDVTPHVAEEKHRARYLFLDQVFAK
jgi:para-nitrobenzyl esterase